MEKIENRNKNFDITTKSQIKPEDVIVIAQQVTNDLSVKIVDYNINDYSSELLGTSGSYWHLKIHIQNTTSSFKTLDFFVKAIPLDCQKRSLDFINIFEKESTFFEKIYPFLMEDYAGEKWSPKCFLATNDKIVLDDLRSQGFKIRKKLFDNTSLIQSALTTLARFHGCSILSEAKLNNLSKNCLTLDNYYPNFFEEQALSQIGYSKDWQDASMNVIAAVAESLDLESDILRKFYKRIYEIIKPSQKYRNVIGHGDLWTNNLMFDDTEPIPKCVLVDFQVIRYAPLVLDILQFLYLNSTRDYRIKNEQNLIKYYYSVLVETLRNNNTTDLISVPSLNEIVEAFEELRLYGIIVACLYLPMLLLDFDVDALSSVNDSNELENFVIGDRVKLTLAAMKKNDFYKKNIEEIVVEFSNISKRYLS